MDPEREASRLAARLGLGDEAQAEILAALRAASPHHSATVVSGDPWEEEPTLAEIEREASEVPPRYQDLGRIGVGGMGEVHRVRDRVLGRVVALKRVRAEMHGSPAVATRFAREAQVAACLQHPGVPPVYDAGRLADGRWWFTMQEVRGHPLRQRIREVHAVSRDGWADTPGGWTLRRLVDAVADVADAVGYAHARGIIHRDLKPDNVMVGAFGEVLVMDWGLAKALGREEDTVDVITPTNAQQTRAGGVAGTPAYMAPEQARGEVHLLDARTDVYALGAMLYEVLVGHPPYRGANADAVLAQVIEGPPPPLVPGLHPREMPADLTSLCARCMARDPSMRPPHGGVVASELRAWLGGAHRREQALAVVAEAGALGPASEALRASAAAMRSEARAILDRVPSWEAEDAKTEGWAKEDAAEWLEREADRLELEAEQRLHGALRLDPTVPEAHAALAERYGAAHAAAEATRDRAGMAREEMRLRAHAPFAPPAAAATWATYLEGRGALTLHTDPAGAEVEIFRYETRNRRLVLGEGRRLGVTPLDTVPLPMGSYLCVVRHPERAEVRYPVSIGRGEHFDGVPPGAEKPAPIHLPRRGELEEDECYIPAGWFWSGGDPDAADCLPRRRLWCEALVARRFPVTNAEYIAFLDDLVARGLEAEALRWAPRERAGTHGDDGAPCYGRDPDGRFLLMEDADGDRWLPEWPVFNVHIGCANAYARWAAARSGLGWRLPGELEWEKAARGVDGRFFPWGDHLDPAWACWRDTHRGRPMPAIVRSFPVDESPYGVRGLGGNVEDWCADRYVAGGPMVDGARVVPPTLPAEVDLSPSALMSRRGGFWNGTSRLARACSRGGPVPGYRKPSLGFRLFRVYQPI